MANNNLLYNAAIEGICSGASRASSDVTGSVYAGINAIATRLAQAIDAAIPPVVGGANTSQAGLMKGICDGVYRYSWPTDPTLDLTTQVDAIVTQYVSQQALLLPVSGGGSEIPRNPRQYWVNNNPETETLEQGTIAYPFHTLQAAVDAIEAEEENAACIYLAPSTIHYTVNNATYDGYLCIRGEGHRDNGAYVDTINLPQCRLELEHLSAATGEINAYSLDMRVVELWVQEVNVSNRIDMELCIIGTGPLAMTAVSVSALNVDAFTNQSVVGIAPTLTNLTKYLRANMTP